MKKKKKKINLYICPSCGGEIVTKDVNDGIAPLIIDCDFCDGFMHTSFYRCDQTLEYSHELFKPTHNWLHNTYKHWPLLYKEKLQEAREGGLDIRKRVECL